MPRITKTPTSVPAAQGRAYALLKQLAPSGEDIKQEALEQYAKLYGDAAAASAASKPEMTFEEFAAVFATSPPDTYPGEGDCVGWAVHEVDTPLTPWRFPRRATGPTDVRIQITFAGICHSDVHQVKDEWKGSIYPMVPGHEIVGIVTEVGQQVAKFKVGDRVGVGCMVDSCQDCEQCLVKKQEQFCKKGFTGTYNAKDKNGDPTYGGYSNFIVVTEKFVVRVPEALPMDVAAPLLCAGITMYSPIRHYGFDKPGMHIGVVGLGGLGHVAVKLLVAMGVQCTVISHSERKKEEALKVLGATGFIASKEADQMEAAADTLDGIINTVSAPHDVAGLMNLLKVDGTMVMIGVPGTPPPLPAGALLFRRLKIGGSIIGGIDQTQEMLDFCAEKGVTCMIESVKAHEINDAYERMVKSDVHYRFVIDVQGSIIG